MITSYLVSGQTKSCGCLAAEKRAAGNVKHGRRWDRSVRAEYQTWIGIRSRCNDSAQAAYVNYGGRGIRVCPEWDDFAQFLADMGPRPGRGYSIERIDNDGPYAPGNCRWATQREQMSNTRINHWFTHNGETLHLSDWARRLGMEPAGLCQRIKRGWSIEEALTIPKGHPRI